MVVVVIVIMIVWWSGVEWNGGEGGERSGVQCNALYCVILCAVQCNVV